MCCFSQPVVDVSDTKIFARFGQGVEQFIAYSMNLEAKEKLAMVLPIPVAKGSGEDAVTFINLNKYSELFDDLWSGFPLTYSRSTSKAVSPVQPVNGEILKVHSVGAFDASFVPTIADFPRLDERYRLPEGVWKQLPGYADFGFAVFKLKSMRGTVHPMAFSFPSSMPKSLFFPTLHIHDGQIHAKEEFDHTLYAQGSGIHSRDWEESPQIAMQFVKCDLTKGLVSPDHHVRRRLAHGLQANGDILLKASKVT